MWMEEIAKMKKEGKSEEDKQAWIASYKKTMETQDDLPLLFQTMTASPPPLPPSRRTPLGGPVTNRRHLCIYCRLASVAASRATPDRSQKRRSGGMLPPGWRVCRSGLWQRTARAGDLHAFLRASVWWGLVPRTAARADGHPRL